MMQKKEKSFQNYTKRFRVEKVVLESHLGSPIIFTNNIKKINKYDVKQHD
jgi:hypothetical protein